MRGCVLKEEDFGNVFQLVSEDDGGTTTKNQWECGAGVYLCPLGSVVTTAARLSHHVLLQSRWRNY
jgi:hypothetical protein